MIVVGGVKGGGVQEIKAREMSLSDLVVTTFHYKSGLTENHVLHLKKNFKARSDTNKTQAGE